MADFRFTNNGSVSGLTPLNEGAYNWLLDNVSAESWQWFGRALYMETRYVRDIVEALSMDGWTVDVYIW